ncbi:MAG: hypothetical protein CVU59_09340 [Deltaproteobacteria bacterium HGW-Deltaproteobacteria-17]|nr:MAG: hypothetical protein CVU59_09340 [Deltaproteobacteria bacterium HGW-Deltaproteobacteria-17]
MIGFRRFLPARLLLTLIAITACGGPEPVPANPFVLPPPFAGEWRPARPAPVCACPDPGGGRFEIRLTWSGKFLTGRARLHVEQAITGAHLLFDPRLAIQKTSWPRGADCSDPDNTEGCTELPMTTAAGATLELEFGFRHPSWSETSTLRAFAFPSLFTIACPAHCRRPLGRWPATFTIRRPDPPLLILAAGMPDHAQAEELTWEEPSARLAMVVFTPPPARLEADLILSGFAERPAEQVLPLLHAFTVFSERPQTGRLQVVFDAAQTAPWGLRDWRFVSDGGAENAALSEISSRLPAWIRAPVHAREGAVLACRLAGVDVRERNLRLKKIKQEYLRWLQQRAAADPVQRARQPVPVAYWTLLFSGTLQRSERGPEPGDCDPLVSTADRPAMLFHEVLSGLAGRIPADIGASAPSVSVRVESILLKKDTVVVKLSNKSRISMWLPIKYKSDQNTWNHWIFLRSSGQVQSFEMQHAGKPVNILIDPEDVTLVLPFGWTEEGPPEDLGETM